MALTAGVRLESLELLHRLRPIALEQSRQCAVGEHPAAGLATRTVVSLVVRIADALHLGAARRAGQSEAPVHRHLRPESGDLLREFAVRLLAQPLRPLRQYRADRIVELADRGLVEPLRQ